MATASDDLTPRTAKEALAHAADAFLDCRDLRHPWKAVGVFYAQGTHGKEVHRKLVCPRCETEAVDKWSPRGIRYARQYKYPKGYSTKGVKIQPVDVRREVMSRVDIFGSEEDMLASLFGARRRKAS